MLTKKRKLDLIALLSVIPLTLSIQMVNTPLNWCMYVLVFMCGIDENYRDTFRRSCIIGFTTAVINFFWIIKSSGDFTGSGGVLLGFGIMLIFCIFFIIYANIVSLLYVSLRWHNRGSKYNWGFTSFLGGCLIGGLDIGMSILGKGFSTCMYLNYIPITFNVYAIQPAAYIGPFVISFFIGMTNFQMAYFLRYKMYKMLILPVGLIFAYIFVGYLLYNNFNKKINSGEITTLQPIKVAVLCENLLPTFTWDSTNGNQLVANLFKLNDEAIKHKVNLGIWSETVLPWVYEKNDDFLKELNKRCTAADMSYIIGVNTRYKGSTYYNSMYSYGPNDSVWGRYDKREALFLAEKPMLGVYLPFLSQGSYLIKEGTSDKPLFTKWGKAGMLLCNESAIGPLATKSVKEGAQFLINAGNDGWFSNTYIIKQHFYYARMRAVENRKDIVINNNNGYSGMVKSNGDIADMQHNDYSHNLYYTIVPNNYQPPITSSYYGFSLIFGILLFVGVEIANIILNKHRWSD